MNRPLKKNGPISERMLVFGICVFLVEIVWLAFGRTLGFGFVNYDDPRTVYESAEVARGLSAEGVAWAFTHAVIGHWDPLTTLSHMADCQIYGLEPAGHHLTNVLLHAAGTILLFLALREMTGALWRSAFVAALFAIHPLRVESVAWITERKDVLSGVFFMLALGAYARYAHGPSAWRYLAVALAFALGLLCKSMLVTLPFVLLLLDYWPLGRWADRRGLPWPLLIEKIPLLLLSATSAAIQIFAASDMITPIQTLSLSARLGNVLVSYVAYLWKSVWPVNLAVFYPSPGVWPAAQVLPAAAVLLGLSIIAVAWRRKRPYILTGWLWYLGMLAPVIGVIQVGTQALADRYTYLPQIGLFLLATWTVADLSASLRHRRLLLGCAAGIVIGGLILLARAQTAYWHDSQTLWNRALACTERNSVAHSNLGAELLESGQVNEAIAHLQKALEIQPLDADAHNNLGNALLLANRVDEAIPHYRSALEIRPDFGSAHANLGRALLKNGQVDEAISHYEKALELQPENPGFQNALAWVLATCPKAASRNGAKAVELARQAYRLTGDDPAILRTLAAAYAQAGRFPEAVDAARRALELTEPKNTALAGAIRREIGLYEAGNSYRDAPQK